MKGKTFSNNSCNIINILDLDTRAQINNHLDLKWHEGDICHSLVATRIK